MKHIDEIISRIEALEDLPISEEMLGAYFESKLSEGESLAVRNIIDSDLFLTNLEQEVMITTEESINIGNWDDGDMEHLLPIVLPEVYIISDIEDNISNNSDDPQLDSGIEYTDFVLDDICENALDNIDNQLGNEDIE